MKTFLEFISEAKSEGTLDIKQDKISKSDAKKYIDIAHGMLSSEAIKVINDIVDADADASDLSTGLYDTEIKALQKAGRIKELPWLLTKEEFNNVINSKKPLDFYVYDLVSEKGRNALAKKFEPMLRNSAYKYANANGISSEDTYSAGLEGFTRALNNYGKKRSEYVRTSSELANVDLDKIAANEEDTTSNISFASYATAMVSNSILDYLQNEMNLVRRPKSNQQKEKEETGQISRQNVVSGDTTVGSDSDGNARSRWDTLASELDAEETSVDNSDELESLWKQIFAMVENKFGKEIAELWYKKNGINGRKKENVASTPTEYYKLRNISKFLTTDKKAFKIMMEIKEIMMED